jgi:imidazolonepropionase-like amidohydrolase/Tol biopolymer transport system component
VTRVRPPELSILLGLLVGGLLFGCQALVLEGESRPVGIDTQEGTWMSVDVAPDGDTLAFDLLGDLYAMPAAGGEACRLTTAGMEPPAPPRDQRASQAVDRTDSQGSPFDSQPRFSPSGDRIAFISDRSGSDNLWVMRADGTRPQQISHERGAVLNSPTWSPDEARIAVRRSTSQRTGELWVYALRDSARADNGRALTDAESLIDAQGPTYAPDGSSIYVASPFKEGGSRSLRRETWQIGRVDVNTGKITRVTNRENGAVRPRLSPGGDTLAYATWVDEQPAMVLRALETGAESVLTRGIERNLQDMYLSHLDLLPGYAFAPDGRSLVLSRDGHLRRVSVPEGDSEVVPFHVETTLEVPERVYTEASLRDTMTVQMVRWPDVGPAGEFVVYEAVGQLWRRPLGPAEESPRPLTSPSVHAGQPALSPDGAAVAFVASPDSISGRHVYRMPVDGGPPARLTDEPGSYARPVWSPDGTRLAALYRESTDDGVTRSSIPEKHLIVLSANGGDRRRLLTAPMSDAGATFGAEGQRLWYTLDGTLRSVWVEGGRRQSHVVVPNARQIVPSPTTERVAVACDNRVFVRPLRSGRVDTISACTEDRPYAERPGRRGYFPTWVGETEWAWTFGGALFRKEGGMEEPPKRVDLGTKVPVAAPDSDRGLGLRGARLIPMTGDRVIESGTVVVRGGRITAVGPTGEVDVPSGAVVRDMSGKTIIPGLIDVHQHALALLGPDEVQNLPDPFGPASALLAYGVTTTRDPALLSNVRDFSMIELLNSGRVPGPHYMTTGERIMPEDYRITNLQDARAAVALQKDLGATYIKEYLQRQRYQRQLLGKAARREDVMITLEGGFDYKTSLTGILDGYTGTEHSPGNHAVYDDITQLVAKTEGFYVPTILSQIGAEHYYRQSDVSGNEKLRRFLPERHLQQLADRNRRGQGVPEPETAFGPLTENVRRVVEAGGTVGVGAHDQPAPTGLGTHWEMWSFVEGGLSPMRALRAATIDGAKILGLAEETGSLEPGKRADLLILNRNPLTDIRHSTAIHLVMQNGQLYDVDPLQREGSASE